MLTGVPVSGCHFRAFYHFSCLFQTVLLHEGQELGLTAKEYILWVSGGIFCGYRMLSFLQDSGNDSALWSLIIIIAIMFVSGHFCNRWFSSNFSLFVVRSKHFEVMKFVVTQYNGTNFNIYSCSTLNVVKTQLFE